ncbi:MAG: hypothetical protein JNK54_06060 [Elusimicrobia bacterium]|jgi:hypothetical protein|nr:hypothetical protein [Elusimicrobiota bacterium]
MSDNNGLVRRHDQYQFEVKLGYDLHPQHTRERYQVDTYFFIPENLDINEATYSKNQFYRDLLLYIRFRTPDFTLSALTDAGSDRSPLAGVVSHLAALRIAPSEKKAQTLDYEIRLLGAVLKNSLRLQTRAIGKLLRAPNGKKILSDLPQAEALLGEFLRQSHSLLTRFRALRIDFEDPTLPKGPAATYAFTDEYLSLLIEERAHEILRLLQDRTEEPLIRAALSITALIEKEVAYRKERGFPSLVDVGTENETLVFRLSVLKKFIASSLHIRVRKREGDRRLEHILLSLGAGLAMIFATAVAFYYQRVYGTVSMGFFFILVISYMMKDRMKALSQDRLQMWLSKNLYDQATSIYDPLTGKKMGVCREAVGFVPEKRVDPLVLKLRNRDHITEIENTWLSEKVIHYTKEITLFSNRFLQFHRRKTGITDIVRFNLRTFLVKMDEPIKKLFTLKEGRSELIPGARVYHVNVILRFASRSETHYERIRLVLNRDGIKRVEPLGTERAPVGRGSFYPSPFRPA